MTALDFRLMACRDNPEAFEDGPGPDPHADARPICGGCPVKAPCLIAQLAVEEGMRAADRHGLVGGLDPAERASLDPTARGRRALPIAHGTDAGQRAHRRRGQDPCEACRVAANVAKDARATRRIARAATVALAVKHGTRGGYQWHLKNKVPVCEGCREATRAASAAHRQRNQADLDAVRASRALAA